MFVLLFIKTMIKNVFRMFAKHRIEPKSGTNNIWKNADWILKKEKNDSVKRKKTQEQ